MRRSLFAVLLLLATCGGDEAPRAKPKSPSPQPVICPLTGEERPRDFAIDRPPLAVKIDNARPARPQAGLETADVVYEELAEGGITRFFAVFHCSDAASVGPVRSARAVDSQLLLEYQPVLFAYSGANPDVRQVIASTSGVVEVRHGDHGDLYRREPGRPAPHNLFTSTDQLRTASGEAKGPPKTELVFAESPSPSPAESPIAPEGEASPIASPTGSPAPPPGRAVSFSYAGSTLTRYTYDEVSGAYLRFFGDEPHNSVAGGQLKAVNVIVMKVEVGEGGGRDAAGNVTPEINVIGSGEAWVLTGAFATQGRWVRESAADQTAFQGADGTAISLRPGNTWIHLVPVARPVTVE